MGKYACPCSVQLPAGKRPCPCHTSTDHDYDRIVSMKLRSRSYEVLLHTLALAMLATAAAIAGSCEAHHDPAKPPDPAGPASGLRARPTARAYLNLPPNDRTPAPALL